MWLGDGEYDKAETILLECVAAAAKWNHSTQQMLTTCDMHLGRLYLNMGRLDEAYEYLTHDGFKALYTPTNYLTLLALYWRWMAAIETPRVHLASLAHLTT
ncbi:Aste57867_15073 [Aphanomyces stellatus]|uniref:Aste57867_15073 protein n=1 Tax=Aphanomyces stellatus TaxID=120398 RepID=A0A485L2W0_9STRA|nr:hypothetical protein As57867_015017 [Aphanomyces stellatus]VFT91886.1 Aste57867_15073 [Aphanomyces stellatus]